MIRNYIKSAWRSLLRSRMTTGVSIFGLMLGVACFFLLATYILNELRYDRFHAKADRIVFANMNYKSPSDAEAVHTASTPTALVPVAKRELPEVEDGARMYHYRSRTISYGEKAFSEKNMIIADASFFRIFSFSFREGDALSALKNPNTLVMTTSTARRYFGDAPALGKMVKIDSVNWQVCGVIDDMPSYSTIKSDIIGAYSSSAHGKKEVWNSANDWSFLLLKSAAQRTSAQHKINAYLQKQFPEDFRSGYKFWFEFEPLTRVHLHSKVASGAQVSYLYILGGIAFLLLVIACINFTNLVTARSSERAREIGVRKVLGAARSRLMLQFMTESGIVTCLSVLIGILLAVALFPAFNRVTGLELSFTIWNAGYFAAVIGSLLVFITLLAGAWPAFVLSSFRPVLVLKGRLNSSAGGSAALRKFLVVFQFTVSIAFIMATFVARKQLNFIQHTKTGMDREQVLVLDGNDFDPRQLDAFKSELMKNRSVKNVTASYDSPVNIQGGYSFALAGRADQDNMSITAIPVDKDFVRTLDMKIISGADFTGADEKQVKQDSNALRRYAFMLNRKAVATLGLRPENAIGREANLNGRMGRITAVLEDFNFASLRQAIEPVVLFAEYDYFGKIMIKTSGGNTTQALAGIERTWKSFFPGMPFDYHFLNDEYNELYKTEQRTTAVLNIFSTVTILISCLGLFGLAVFTALQRTKEIGIRKVLGATVGQVTLLLSYDFLKLVFLAVLIAAPLAWYAMHTWLQDFAYKISMPYGSIVLAGLLAVSIAFITVSYQAIRSSLANPVRSLRSE